MPVDIVTSVTISTKPSWECHVNAIIAKANCHRPNNITFILLYYFDVK